MSMGIKVSKVHWELCHLTLTASPLQPPQPPRELNESKGMSQLSILFSLTGHPASSEVWDPKAHGTYAYKQNVTFPFSIHRDNGSWQWKPWVNIVVCLLSVAGYNKDDRKWSQMTFLFNGPHSPVFIIWHRVCWELEYILNNVERTIPWGGTERNAEPQPFRFVFPWQCGYTTGFRHLSDPFRFF